MQTSKSIRLPEESYERLAAHNRKDQAFSEVVVWLAGERPLLALAGILREEDADGLGEAIDERGERRTADLEEPVDRLSGA